MARLGPRGNLLLLQCYPTAKIELGGRYDLGQHGFVDKFAQRKPWSLISCWRYRRGSRMVR